MSDMDDFINKHNKKYQKQLKAKAEAKKKEQRLKNDVGYQNLKKLKKGQKITL